jgi:hypothetical protein
VFGPENNRKRCKNFRFEAASCVVWLTVALGLPFWLFIVPPIGVPLLIIIATVISSTDIVRSVRWRRQYELSIDRLIRISTNGRDRQFLGITATGQETASLSNPAVY